MFSMKIETIFSKASQWFSETPERALDRAYKAALKIKDIEDKYFKGSKVSRDSSDYGESVITYFSNEVGGYLKTIDAGMIEFKASRLFMNLTDWENSPLKLDKKPVSQSQESDPASLMLDKLKFIDEVRAKYKVREAQNGKLQDYTSDSPEVLQPQVESRQLVESVKIKTPKNGNKSNLGVKVNANVRAKKVTEKSGVLPRSFLTMFDRIRQEIDPKSSNTEQEVLQKFRSSRYKTAVSIKFILLLIIVPLLTHQLTKNLLLTPVVERYFSQNDRVVFINRDLEEEALVELKHFEETLHFKGLIGFGPKLTSEETEAALKEKAAEISESFRNQGIDAISNIFADLLSLGGFATVIVMNRKDIEVVKSFIDEIFYTLSDSAKAFLIILFTDMFVGFHSPHGWEVILESISRHFGLPENRSFNFLFIATFPVILDTILKYWIFRYLNRISPSAVATYRNMNE
jgi:hypothetical protein